MTIILGGDSLIHKNKENRNQLRAAATPRGCDNTEIGLHDMYL